MLFNALRQSYCVFLAIGILAMFTMPAYAEEFTGASLLAWEEKQQDWYFQTSVTMASFIAAQNQDSLAQCIDKWYFEETATKNVEIRQKLTAFSTYHPSGIILAVIEKACGKFQ